MSQPEKAGPGRILIGGAVVVIGILVLIPSGLCTTILGFIAVADLINSPKGFLSDWNAVGPIVFAVPIVAIVAIILIRIGLTIRGRN